MLITMEYVIKLSEMSYSVPRLKRPDFYSMSSMSMATATENMGMKLNAVVLICNKNDCPIVSALLRSSTILCPDH